MNEQGTGIEITRNSSCIFNQCDALSVMDPKFLEILKWIRNCFFPTINIALKFVIMRRPLSGLGDITIDLNDLLIDLVTQMKISAHNKLKTQPTSPINGLNTFRTLFIFLMILTTGGFLLTAFLWYQNVEIRSWQIIPTIIILIILVSLAGAIVSSRRFISSIFETLIEKKRQYSLEKLWEFSSTVESLTDLNQIAPSLIKMVHMTLKCPTIILLAPERHGRSTWSSWELQDNFTTTHSADWPAEWLRDISLPYESYTSESLISENATGLSKWFEGPPESREIIKQDISHLIPLRSGSELVGLLMLGPKKSQGLITDQNLKPVIQSCWTSATVIHKILLNEEIRLQSEQLRENRTLLLHSGQLASVGTLAAVAVHEVNNPNFVISGMSEMILANPEKHLRSPEALQYIGTISEMSERISQIVQGLLIYSYNEQDARIVDLNQIADSALNLARHKLNTQSIEVERAYYLDLPTIKAVPNHMQQVLLNLIINAIDAMEMGNQITLTTGISNNRVWLSCSDTGQGIAEDDLTHIFDPFFTTKPPGEGTGLGLHLARTILDECSGNISVVSEEGIGSTFTIDFPISEGYVVPVTTYEKNEADLQTSPT